MHTIQSSQLPALWRAVEALGYSMVGPQVRDGAIVYDKLETPEDLPRGYHDEQRPGHYRLRKHAAPEQFGYTLAPQSWKRMFLRPSELLWRAQKRGDQLELATNEETLPAPLCLVGVRACELHAISRQDRALLGGPHVDEAYRRRRKRSLVIAVSCTQASPTCFCASMNTGPQPEIGYNLRLTELLDEDGNRFVVKAGSERGTAILAGLSLPEAAAEEVSQAEARVEAAAASMTRSIEQQGVKELLYANVDHPRWAEVAERCLTCGNCTQVCPTCFCTVFEDRSSLGGDEAERWRLTDSCFTHDFSYIHGGPVRRTPKSRYRHWMMHKLATWQDQFGTSGCVGCGRCIVWCPVGIDITEEVRAIQEADCREMPPPQAVEE